jgi:hypothetical protein
LPGGVWFRLSQLTIGLLQLAAKGFANLFFRAINNHRTGGTKPLQYD